MEKSHNDRLMRYHQKAFEELYIADSLIQLTRTSCLEKEFRGQYYGIARDMSKKLSAERNNYINMLTILSDKISNIIDLSLSIEKELLLQKNPNNGSR